MTETSRQEAREGASTGSSEAFYLDSWQVEPGQNRLIRDGHSVRVEPKVMDLLVYLASKAPEVVSREVLLDEVWADAVVGDEALSLSISKLRRAFADDPRAPRVVETIPKRGYRLIAPVERPTEGGAARPTSPVWRWRYLLGLLGLLAIVALAWQLLVTTRESSTAPEAEPPVAELMEVDRSELVTVPVTTLPGRERDAAISPDGRFVAFAWAEEPRTGLQIYVKELDGGPATVLVELAETATALSPVWSADGSEVAFLHYEGAACSVVAASVRDGTQRVLADCDGNQLGELAWSPSGEWLAFPQQLGPDEPAGLVLYSVASGEQRRLMDSETTASDHEPVFSPDEKHLSFKRSQRARVGDLFVVPAWRRRAGASNIR